MSVSLSPSTALGFNRPLTVLVKRTLAITNHNAQPVAFKVKTTAPKLYCVRPNSGRVEPGESVEVSVMLQAMKEEPPITAKCKDKFLIQSTTITPDKDRLSLAEIWSPSEGGEATQVHQQKLRVVYLPPEGQTLEEEDEGHDVPVNGQPLNASSYINGAPTTFHTVAQRHPDDHQQPIPDFKQEPSLDVPQRPFTPQHDYSESHEEQPLDGPGFTTSDTHRNSPSPPLETLPPAASKPVEPVFAPKAEPFLPPPFVSAPAPAPAPPPAPAPLPQPDFELQKKYNDAQAEIERLRALLATAPTTEVRRRTRALSDVGSTTSDGAMGSVIEDGPLQQDGVPLQVVVIIALGVFVTTYLFF